MSDLGKATFTVQFDDAKFKKELDDLEKGVKQWHKTVDHEFGAAGQSIHKNSQYAKMGILQIGYAVDDLQYGFRSIVNNIPQIVLGLGGTAGMAGAVAILSVGVNQAISHWEELKTSFGNTAPIEAARGAVIQLQEAFKTGAKGEKEEVGLFSGDLNKRVFQDIMELSGHWDDATKAAERHAEAVKKVADAMKMIEGTKGTETSANGREFRASVEDYGGGQKLLDDAVKQQAARGGIKDKDALQNLRDTIAKQIAGGMAGEDVNMKGLPPRLGEVMKNREDIRASEKERKATTDAARVKEKDEDTIRRKIHDRLASEKTARMQALEDQRKKVLDEQKEFDEAEWQRQHDKAAPGQIIQGAKASLDLYQTAGGGENAKAIAERAHAQRLETNLKLTKIQQELEKERRLVVPR